MNDEQAGLVFHGPICTHDVHCLIHGCENKAVFEFGTPGMFTPCWECRAEGFGVTRPEKRMLSDRARVWLVAAGLLIAGAVCMMIGAAG